MASVRQLDDAARSLEQSGITCELLEMNSTSSIVEFSKKVKEWCNNDLNVLINNAGVAFPVPIEILEPEVLASQFQINAFGHMHVTRLLLDDLRRCRGRVIMISSQAAVLSSPMVGAYSASKRALEALSEALLMEVGDEIEISIIRPGPYATSIWESSAKIGQRYLGDSSRYRSLALAIQALSMSRAMPPASQLADLVMRVIEAKKMRFIYGAPFSAQLSMLIRRFIPNRLFFKLMTTVIGRKKKSFEAQV